MSAQFSSLIHHPMVLTFILLWPSDGFIEEELSNQRLLLIPLILVKLWIIAAAVGFCGRK